MLRKDLKREQMGRLLNNSQITKFHRFESRRGGGVVYMTIFITKFQRIDKSHILFNLNTQTHKMRNNEKKHKMRNNEKGEEEWYTRPIS